MTIKNLRQFEAVKPKADPQPLTSNLPPFIRRQDFGPVLGIHAHRTTISQWIDAGKWPEGKHLGHRTVVWNTEELIKHLNLSREEVAIAWANLKEQARTRGEA
jgi:predicted DNA-binding transcriptional regulator AlpA